MEIPVSSEPSYWYVSSPVETATAETPDSRLRWIVHVSVVVVAVVVWGGAILAEAVIDSHYVVFIEVVHELLSAAHEVHVDVTHCYFGF